jgi:hypothetical protein
MKKEKYKKWLPLEDIPDRLYLDGLYDDWEGFRLLLRHYETGRMLRITFDPALSYRNTDEGDLLKTEDISEGFFKWPLYIVENSRFLKWFHEESYEIRKKDNPLHYAIVTQNDFIDVISAFPPIVEWINDKKK